MAAEFAADVLADLHVQVRQNLALWDLPAATSIRVLNVSENATFLLTDPRGAERVLRVHRLGYSSSAQIRSELAWIDALREDAVVETAAPLAGADGSRVQTLATRGKPPRFAVAFERLPGREPDADDAPRWFRRLGGLAAALHRHGRSWQRPGDFCRKRWDVDAMVGAQALWGPWRAAIGLDRTGAAVLERAVALIRVRLERFGVAPDRFGLVHADLRLANLLVDGERLRVIDFDDCGSSWYGYDFAASISFIEHEPMVPALFSDWCEGYRAVGPLDAAVEAEAATFVILRRILLTAWLASHAEVPLARDQGTAFTSGTVTLAEEWLGGRFLNRGVRP